jgi:hypothetical protein
MPFNRKHHHVLGEIRPRFNLLTTYTEEEIFDLLDEQMKDDPTVIGRRVYGLYYLDIRKEKNHFWSPELRVSPEKNEAGEGTFIRCVIGPRHSVWLMFVFIYGFLSVVSLFGGMYGLAQWNMGHPTGWIWCFPITIFLIIAVFVTAKLGQRTGRDQTLHLVSVLYHALKEREVIRK